MKRLITISLFIFPFLLFSSNSIGSENYIANGNGLLNYWCSSTKSHRDAVCLGFIAGVIHAINSNSQFQKTSNKYCGPNVPIIQSKAIVVKYLNDHPEKLHLDSYFLILDAIQKAFPCPK